MEQFWFLKKSLSLAILCIVVVHQGHAQTLEAPSVTCGDNAVLKCVFSGTFAAGATRTWRKGLALIVSSGTSQDSAKYMEDLSSTASGYFTLTITNFMETDNDVYECVYGFGKGNYTVNCTEPTRPAPPECEGECCLILIYACGICNVVTFVMWLICRCLQCNQTRCFIWLIVNGFFALVAWISFFISYSQSMEQDCCQCQKAGFIVPIVLVFCAAAAFFFGEIFCCLQYIRITHSIPPCCGFCVCIDCEDKIELQSNYAILHPSKPLEKEREIEATSTNSPLKLEN